jgi:hypothetical protein
MASLPHPPLSHQERWRAALAYLGIGALVVLAWGQGRFSRSHAWTAALLHLLRLIISGLGLGLWHVSQRDAALAPGDWLDWLWHLITMALLGLPHPGFGGVARSPWLAPAGAIWLLDLAGALIALSGRSLPWPAPVVDGVAAGAPAVAQQERARLRRLRDQRLAQIRSATATAAGERLRERRIHESKRELGANLVRLDHLNHLLATDQLSGARHRALAGEVEEEITALREELAALGARISGSLAPRSEAIGRVAGLGGQLQARTLSLSFVDRSGMPLFTFGQFPLDEALIAGMLSAFNSLSQEIFGSPVHKTHLAKGQVLYFVHGQWCVLMALFDAEPSPAQTAHLQSCLTTFEYNNAAELQRDPVTPARLRPIGIDFDLAQPA